MMRAHAKEPVVKKVTIAAVLGVVYIMIAMSALVSLPLFDELR